MAEPIPATARTGPVKGACPHDCPDACAWEVTVEDGAAVRLAGSRAHPFTRGALCAKVNRYLDRVYSPERVLQPLRRVGGKSEGAFRPVGWDEALTEIAGRLRAVLATHGGEAVLPYSFAGNQGVIEYGGMGNRFFARLGASRLARTICGSTAAAGVRATLGATYGILPEDVVQSRFILLWGTNTVVTNVHLWPFIRRGREAGARLVVIDPLRTRTAAEADWHVRPIPGTDAALALGMMHVIVAEGLHDADYVERHTVGFDRLRDRLAEYPPSRAADLCGVPADEIVALARAYATTRPAVIRTLVGPEKHPEGGMLLRTIACLPALVGAWRERGGGLLPSTAELFLKALAIDAVEMPQLASHKTRLINMVQLGRALTDPALRPPILVLFVYNANPAVIAPNQGLVVQGLRREDLFTVVHDLFLTDTARYADFVLPATSFVEEWDLVTSWGHQYLSLNRPAIAPRGEAVSNTELFRRLASVMGFDEPCFRETEQDLIRAALGSGHPYLKGVTFERLLEEGWAPLALPADWRPFAEGGFPTSSGKCELYSERLAARGLDPLPGYRPPAGDGYPLVLISAKSALHFLNSSYAHLPRHARAEGEPHLDMHADDAAARGIRDGELVRAHNRRGSVVLRARVGDGVRPGVVAMPHGWWPSRSPSGASANALTSDGLADLGGGSDLYSTRVEVERVTTSS